MTIFQLLVYSCVATHSLGGDLMSQICRWDEREFYRDRPRCEDVGTSEVGRPIHEFAMLPGGPRKVERHKCYPINVN